MGSSTRPRFLTINDEVVTVSHRRRCQCREIRSGIRLTHSDTPSGLTGQNSGQELSALICGSIGVNRRTHLSICDPTGGDGRSGPNHLFRDNDALDARSAATPELRWPGHPDPTLRSQNFGEIFTEAVDPRVVVPSKLGNALKGDTSRVHPQQLPLRAHSKI